jgi:hypothetical protein
MKVEEITATFSGLKAGDRVTIYKMSGARRIRETNDIRQIKGFIYLPDGNSVIEVDFSDGSYLKLLLEGYCWFFFQSRVITDLAEGNIVTGIETTA